MINADLIPYRKQVFNFLHTLTIKYGPLEDLINDLVVRSGFSVDVNDPTTWKYYVNMAGNYHAMDTPMYITSLDTQEKILFSKDILPDHPRTKASYVPGSAYYKRLCAVYPQQVDLIKSILFPISDVNAAISADDLTLLNYGSGFLESYEEPMIVMAVESFLEYLRDRWLFSFLRDEPYYDLTLWGQLWPHLAGAIFTERVTLIRSPFVHSWNIWQYLQSNGLDNYSDVLDRQKSLMLYQNIKYFRENAGKSSTLITLVDNLLSDIGVGLYGRRVVQETKTGAANYQLTPQLTAVKIPTTYSTITSEIPDVTIGDMQATLVADGLTKYDDAQTVETVTRHLGDTTRNNMITKFLEIRPIAKNKPYADQINTFLLDMLMTTIAADIYTATVEITDPLTGMVLILSTKEAMLLYHYATQRSLLVTPTEIPTYFMSALSFNTTIPAPAATIPYKGKYVINPSSYCDTATYFANTTYPSSVQTTDEFSDLLTTMWLQFVYQDLLDQKTLDYTTTYALTYLNSLCRTPKKTDIDFANGITDFPTWMQTVFGTSQRTMFDKYERSSDPVTNYGTLADQIISTLIPMNDTLQSFGNFTLSDQGYTRLRELFVQMCSYTVVFIDADRNTPEFITGAKFCNDYGGGVISGSSNFVIKIGRNVTDKIVMDGLHRFLPGVKTTFSGSQSSKVTWAREQGASSGPTTVVSNAAPRPMKLIVSGASATSGSIRNGSGPFVSNLSTDWLF